MRNQVKVSIKYAVASVLLMLTASCSQETYVIPERPASAGSEESVPLSISTNLDAELSAATRAAVTSGSMGVYQSPNEIYNRQYTYSGGSWISSSPIMLGPEKKSVLVIYPQYTPTATNGTTIEFPAYLPYSAANDICYASTGSTPTVCNTNPNINLSLSHLYARVKIKVQLGSSDTSSGTVQSVSIALKSGSTNVSIEGTRLNISGTCSPKTKNSNDIIVVTVNESITASKPSEKFDILISPVPNWIDSLSKTISDIIISVVYENNEYQASISATTLASMGLTAGIESIISVTLINNTEIIVDSITADEWKEKPLSPPIEVLIP